jgi:hypothetical protein
MERNAYLLSLWERKMNEFNFNRSRSVPRLITAAVELYRFQPVLFFVFAVTVVAPYDVAVVLARGGGGPFPLGGSPSVLLIAPLIAALYACMMKVQLRNDDFRLSDVGARYVKVFPALIITLITAYLGIGVASLFLIVPGVILALRWSVAGPAVAIEGNGPFDALRRSGKLTSGHYWHILGLTLIVEGLAFMAALIVHVSPLAAGIGTVAFEIIMQIIVTSFIALILLLLYFDLCHRRSEVVGR